MSNTDWLDIVSRLGDRGNSISGAVGAIRRSKEGKEDRAWELKQREAALKTDEFVGKQREQALKDQARLDKGASAAAEQKLNEQRTNAYDRKTGKLTRINMSQEELGRLSPKSFENLKKHNAAVDKGGYLPQTREEVSYKKKFAPEVQKQNEEFASAATPFAALAKKAKDNTLNLNPLSGGHLNTIFSKEFTNFLSSSPEFLKEAAQQLHQSVVLKKSGNTIKTTTVDGFQAPDGTMFATTQENLENNVAVMAAAQMTDPSNPIVAEKLNNAIRQASLMTARNSAIQTEAKTAIAEGIKTGALDDKTGNNLLRSMNSNMRVSRDWDLDTMQTIELMRNPLNFGNTIMKYNELKSQRSVVEAGHQATVIEAVRQSMPVQKMVPFNITQSDASYETAPATLMENAGVEDRRRM